MAIQGDRVVCSLCFKVVLLIAQGTRIPTHRNKDGETCTGSGQDAAHVDAYHGPLQPGAFLFSQHVAAQHFAVATFRDAETMARASGSVYELEGGGNWRTAADDEWEIEVESIDGPVVGQRKIDGALCVIISSNGRFYGVLKQNVTMGAISVDTPRQTKVRRRDGLTGTLIAIDAHNAKVRWDGDIRDRFIPQNEWATVETMASSAEGAQTMAGGPFYQGAPGNCPKCGAPSEVIARGQGGWTERRRCKQGHEFSVEFNSSNDPGTVTQMARGATMAQATVNPGDYVNVPGVRYVLKVLRVEGQNVVAEDSTHSEHRFPLASVERNHGPASHADEGWPSAGEPGYMPWGGFSATTMAQRIPGTEPFSQSTIDRAVEWVNENTDLEGAAWERKVVETCRELAGIDRENDRAERQGRPAWGGGGIGGRRGFAQTMDRQTVLHDVTEAEARRWLADNGYVSGGGGKYLWVHKDTGKGAILRGLPYVPGKDWTYDVIVSMSAAGGTQTMAADRPHVGEIVSWREDLGGGESGPQAPEEVSGPVLGVRPDAVLVQSHRDGREIWVPLRNLLRMSAFSATTMAIDWSQIHPFTAQNPGSVLRSRYGGKQFVVDSIAHGFVTLWDGNQTRTTIPLSQAEEEYSVVSYSNGGATTMAIDVSTLHEGDRVEFTEPSGFAGQRGTVRMDPSMGSLAIFLDDGRGRVGIQRDLNNVLRKLSQAGGAQTMAQESTVVTRQGVVAHVLRRYSVNSAAWLEVRTNAGVTLSWPEAETFTIARASTFASQVACPLCNGTGMEPSGTSESGARYRAGRCRACNGEKLVSPERAERIRTSFGLGAAPTIHTKLLAAPAVAMCPECHKQVAVQGGRYAVHDNGENHGFNCPESGKPIARRPLGYATKDGTTMASVGRTFELLAQRHYGASIAIAGSYAQAKFPTKDAADAFASDLQSHTGQRPVVEASFMGGWFASLQLPSASELSASRGTTMARSDSTFAEVARKHGALSIDESSEWLGAKFPSKAAADAFAEDVQAGIGKRPKVSSSPMNPNWFWAQIRV